MLLKKIYLHINQTLRNLSICCSLFFIVVNPMDNENQEKGFSFYPTESTKSEKVLNNSPNPHKNQKILDYYKLGKLFLLQGEVAPSYKAFAMGNEIDGVRGLMDKSIASKDDFAIANDMPIEQSTVNNYLGKLIALYERRIEHLIKINKLDKAEDEVKKVLIVDPLNAKIKKFDEIIKEKLAIQAKKESPEAKVKVVKVARPVKKISVVKAIAKEPNVSITEALKEAENTVSQAILESSDEENLSILLRNKFNEGKKYLRENDFLRAIQRFKKVIALDSNNIYANYSREYIDLATRLLKEEEDRNLAEISNLKESLLEKTVSIDEKKSSENLVVEEKRNASGSKNKEQELLNQQINKVVLSIRKLLSTDLKQANKDIEALALIAPESQKVLKLKEEIIKKLVEQKNDKKIKIQLQKERIKKIYNELNEIYLNWQMENKRLAKDLLAKKIKLKLDDIEYLISEKNYFTAYDKVEKVFLIDSNNTKALELKDIVTSSISKYSQKFMPLKKKIKETGIKNKNVANNEVKVLSVNVKASKKQKKSKLNESKLKGLFGGISKYSPSSSISDKNMTIEIGKPIVLIDPKVKVSKVEEANILSPSKEENVVVKKDLAKAVSEKKQNNETDNNKNKVDNNRDDNRLENIDKWLNKWKSADENSLRNTIKIAEYMRKGKRFMQDGNYALAMINFNKVKGIDVDGKYSEELKPLLSETEKKLG